ncbi:MAG: hypothetical protein ABIE94_05175 [archaeon]
MKKKGQAATEYLLTYGWAFMAILVTVGALAYFGVVNPTQFVPDRCNFGSQMDCVDFMIDDSTGVHMMIVNNYGKDIRIMDINSVNDPGLNCELEANALPQPIPLGEKKEIICTTSSISLDKGGKRQIPMTITFRRDEAGSVEHNVTGEVYSIVQ